MPVETHSTILNITVFQCEEGDRFANVEPVPVGVEYYSAQKADDFTTIFGFVLWFD